MGGPQSSGASKQGAGGLNLALAGPGQLKDSFEGASSPAAAANTITLASRHADALQKGIHWTSVRTDEKRNRATRGDSNLFPAVEGLAWIDYWAPLYYLVGGFDRSVVLLASGRTAALSTHVTYDPEAATPGLPFHPTSAYSGRHV